MKKLIIKTLLVTALLGGFGQFANAQRIFVKIQPVAPVIVRPVAPSVRHVWIEGEWVWRGAEYVWQPGYWVVPEPHKAWIPGHWRKAYGGWNWVPGHWRRFR